jgi:hypothetical protein
MEIIKANNISSNAINSYNKVVKTTGKPVPPSGNSGARGGNFDTLEINFAQSMARAKADRAEKLAGELAAADSARIQSLKTAYTGDFVPVSFSAIASAILGDM